MAATGAETTLLKAYLTGPRKHVLGILDGLDDEQLRRPVLPSGWSCLAVVQHLTLDVERFWFGAVVAGEQSIVEEYATPSDDAWVVGPDTSAEAVLARYRREIELADAVIDATPLDGSPAWWPSELFGDWRMDSLREVILHVITETACHAGQLDAVRELLDGRQWLVLTGDS
jgi:uncharacterized damage-inducible protein DinB